MPYITEEGLRELKNYKYQGGSYSWIDTNVAQPFWTWSINFVPLWIAPNLLTLFSMGHCMFACALMLYFSPNMDVAAPWWVYVVAAWCIFMYQTLDALDGKQARRTGSSSPLGQLFDHGCDAVCCACMALMSSCMFLYGASDETIAVFLVHVIPFWTLNWEESFSGVMQFGWLGVTEAQLSMIVCLLGAAIFGPEVYTTIQVMGYELRLLVIVASALSIGQALVSSVWTVAKLCLHHGGNGTAAILKMMQFIAFLALGITWLHSPDKAVFAENAPIMLFGLGMTFAHLSSRLIISHVTRSPFANFHPILLPLPLMAINSHLPVLLDRQPLLNEQLVAGIYLAWVLFIYMHYSVSVIQEICASLGIQAFTIKPVKQS